jgi:hypothetical protein
VKEKKIKKNIEYSKNERKKKRITFGEEYDEK